MSGQKQLEHDTKAKLDRMDESKRELLKLTYEAPIFHSMGEYLYIILADCIKDCDGMETMLTAKTRETMERKLQEVNNRMEQQTKLTELEKQREEQRNDIIKLITGINRADIIEYLHTFITGKLQGVNLESEV
jgi:hypothetical protein